MTHSAKKSQQMQIQKHAANCEKQQPECFFLWEVVGVCYSSVVMELHQRFPMLFFRNLQRMCRQIDKVVFVIRTCFFCIFMCFLYSHVFWALSATVQTLLFCCLNWFSMNLIHIRSSTIWCYSNMLNTYWVYLNIIYNMDRNTQQFIQIV